MMETKVRAQVDPKTLLAVFNESFTFPLSLTTTKHGFAEKKAMLGVYTTAPTNRIKALGACSVNIAGLSATNETASLSLPLLNCPDRKAHLDLDITLARAGKPAAKRPASRSVNMGATKDRSRAAPQSTKVTAEQVWLPRQSSAAVINSRTPQVPGCSSSFCYEDRGSVTVPARKEQAPKTPSERTSTKIALIDFSQQQNACIMELRETGPEEKKWRRPEPRVAMSSPGTALPTVRRLYPAEREEPEPQPNAGETEMELEGGKDKTLTEVTNTADYRVHTEALIKCLKRQLQDRDVHAKDLQNRLDELQSQKEGLEQELAQSKTMMLGLESARTQMSEAKLGLETEVADLRRQLAQSGKDSHARGEETETLKLRLAQLGEQAARSSSEFQRRLGEERATIAKRVLLRISEVWTEVCARQRAGVERAINLLGKCGVGLESERKRRAETDTQCRKLREALEKLKPEHEDKLVTVAAVAVDIEKASTHPHSLRVSSSLESATPEEVQTELTCSGISDLISEGKRRAEECFVLKQSIAEKEKLMAKQAAELSTAKEEKSKQAQGFVKCIQECKRLKLELAKCRQEIGKLTQDSVRHKEEAKKAREEQKRDAESFRSCIEQLNEYKMKLADAELLRDRVQIKKKELDDAVAGQGTRIEILEAELIRAKQDLGEALNTMHDFAAEHPEYTDVMEKKLTFKEVSPPTSEKSCGK